MFGFKHGFTVSDQVLTAIGCTVVCQSNIEIQLAFLIHKLLGLEYTKGCAVTSGMSFKNLCTTLSALVVEVIGETDDRLDKIKDLLARLQQFEEFRNQVAHSAWAHDIDFVPEKGTRIKTITRRNKKVAHQSESVDVQRISEEISAAMGALFSLTMLVSAIAGIPVQTIDATMAEP